LQSINARDAGYRNRAWRDFGAGFAVLAVIAFLTGWTSLIYEGFISRKKYPINCRAGLATVAGVGLIAIGLGVSKLLRAASTPPRPIPANDPAAVPGNERRQALLHLPVLMSNFTLPAVRMRMSNSCSASVLLLLGSSRCCSP
jgi:hypothetical protein